MTVHDFSDLIIAFGVISANALAWRAAAASQRNGEKIDTTNLKVDASNENIHKIEIATNHMKDALVASTAKASHAEGLAEGKAEKANSTP